MMRLSEPLGVLAMAADLATARPPGSSLTGAIVGIRLAHRASGDEALAQTVYYTALFGFVGCTAFAHEAGQMALGDDRGFSLAFLLCDWLDLDALQAALDENVAMHAPENERQAAFRAILDMADAIPEVTRAHCAQAEIFARRLPLPAAVLPNMAHFYSRWDGLLGGIGGEDIPLAARIVAVAHVADLYRHLKGEAAARAEIANRAGKHLDPTLCAVLEDNWDAINEGLDEAPVFDCFVATEPGEGLGITRAHCEPLALIAADFVGQKTTFGAGHSRRVSALAGRAGQIAGLDGEQVDALRHAGLLHDIGKCAVSNRILEKAGPLTASERLEFESYSFQTDFLLSHGAVFDLLRPVASSADERFDGSGFHRRVPVRGLAENILAAANLLDELCHDAPDRAALDREEALERLSDESRQGRLAPRAVSAVMQAAGASASAAAQALPFDLTRREAEVMARPARSESTARIARALAISEKTADHHIQAIYAKTGVRNRPAIAILAIEYGLAGS